MRTLGAVCAAAALSSILVARGAADDASFASRATVNNVGGAEIYGHICQGCHMSGGLGAVGAGHYPKLAGDRALVSWQYVALTVLNGRNGMPAFGLSANSVPLIFSAHLTDAQVADVVNYVRSNFGNRFPGSITAKQVAGLPHPEVPAPVEAD